MNPYRPQRLMAPPPPHARAEIAKALHALAIQDEAARRAHRDAEVRALRGDLEDIRELLRKALAEWRFQLQAELRKYSPDQPRVPKGNPDGGQWTKEYADAVAANSLLGSETIPDTSRQAGSEPASRPSRSYGEDSQVISDVTPDNLWIPGAQYAAGWPHHFVPWGVFKSYKLRPDTRQVFVEATSGPLEDTTVNRWSAEHKAYNDAVDEAFESYLARNNIADEETERLTPAQAEEFLDEVYYSSDPRIRSFNMRIWREEFNYWLRYGGNEGGAGRSRGGGGGEE